MANFDLILITPSYLYTFTIILGLLIGSFLNVVIYRLPKMLEQDWKHQCAVLLEQDQLEKEFAKEEKITLSKPNSTCPKCQHQIKPWENIPVLSFLFLGGKCSQCKNKISIRYPLVEVATSLLSLMVIMTFGATYPGLAALFLTWALIALTMIDADTKLLPDNITLPLLWAGLILNSFNVFTTLESSLWGAVFGYLSLWFVYQLFKQLTGKEGMGYGDFKLLGALGAWLGWQQLPIIILLSSVVGAIIGIALILIKGRDKNIPIPFGPYLAIAGWISLIWGEELFRFWMSTV
jgi:leader peptidase (prepilin peptidase)/N-methyltransferase